MTYKLKEKYNKEVVPQMIEKFGYKSKMAVPKIEKVTVNSGIGSVKDDARKEMIRDHLAIITGQRPSERSAKKSIASFKIREGLHIGYSATLRGKRMYDFLERMIFVAIPRGRDFRGLDVKSVDSSGNLTIGFKDHLIFPEMMGEDTRNSFGFSVTIVTTAKNREESVEFLRLMGIPFKK
ncbi:MAG: 50S ribosomal protein L5 [Patescibacteria group bacterium]